MSTITGAWSLARGLSNRHHLLDGLAGHSQLSTYVRL
jgi:hypothetical protein